MYVNSGSDTTAILTPVQPKKAWENSNVIPDTSFILTAILVARADWSVPFEKACSWATVAKGSFLPK